MKQWTTTQDFINNGKIPSSATAGFIVQTEGFNNKGDGGGASWKFTGLTGQTPSQSPAQLADGLLNDASGNQWSLVESNIDTRMYGVVGDQFADDKLSLQAAINHLKSINRQASHVVVSLVPDGNITGLHDVRLSGNGGVTDGTVVFYTNPNSNNSNKIYIDISGDDNNAGVSALSPFATIQAAFNAVQIYGPKLEGFWSFIVGAGTYDGAVWSDNLNSDEVVALIGPDVSNGVPTAIIDGTGSSKGRGILFGRFGAYQIKDIKCQNWVDKSGITAPGHCRVVAENYHAENCNTGAEIRYSAEFQAGPYGRYDNNFYGIRFLHTSTGFIARNATSREEGIIFTGNTLAGVRLQEQCTSHVDYCTFEDNNRGVDVLEESRSSINDCDFKRNGTGILVRANSSIFNNANIFNEGTIDANTVAIDRRASSYDQTSIEYNTVTIAETDISTGNVTSDSEVDVKTFNLQPNIHVAPGKKISLLFSGFMSGAGNKTFRVYLEGQLAATLISTTGSNQLYKAEVTIYPRNSTDQLANGTLLENNQSTRVIDTSSIGADMSTAGTKELKITFQGTDPASSANFRVIELSVAG